MISSLPCHNASMSYKILVLISWICFSKKKHPKNGSVFKLHGSHKSQKSPSAINHCKKKTGFAIITCETTLNNWKNTASPRDYNYLSIFGGPRFSLGFPRWIGGGPRFFQATTTDGSIIANPPPERDTWPNRDTAAPGVKVGGAEKWREGFPVPVTWDMWTQVQDHLEVGFEFFETIFIRHLGFSCKFEKQIKIKVLNYHYHVFKNFHLSKSRWKETTSIIL